MSQILAEGYGCRRGGGGGDLVFTVGHCCLMMYLGDATGNHQRIIKICRSRSKRHIPFQTPLGSKIILL